MIVVYPVLIEYDEDSDCYLVEVPDLKVNTNGDSLSDAICMARDLIGFVLRNRNVVNHCRNHRRFLILNRMEPSL